MKYIYVLLIITITMGIKPAIYAQVTNSESFDGTTFVPSGWTNLLTSGSATWTRVTSGTTPSCSPHTGSGMAKFNSYSASTGVRSIITPSYDLRGRGSATPTVSIWMYRDNGYSSSGDKVDLYINTSAAWSGGTLLATIYRSTSLSPTTSVGWHQYTYNIPSSFSSATNYFIIKATSAFGDNIFVDDVSWQSYPCTPPTITGTAVVCPGSTTTLTGAPTGGTWSSSSSAIATAVTSMGVITGVSSGTATITYATSATCRMTKLLTVNPSPATVTVSGGGTFCGNATLTAANGASGTIYFQGTASGGTSIASPSTSESVSATGTYYFRAQSSSGCWGAEGSAAVTINAAPSAITGSPVVCIGAPHALGNSVTGGTWSTSNGAIASITPSTGIVTGVSTGTATITYTLSSGCRATLPVTVSTSPSPISGTANVCQGSSTTLSDGGGGIWSSSNTSVAAIGSGSGILTGIAAGTPVITYTLPSGCTATKAVTVNPLPAPISGVSSLCASGSTSLTDASGAGAWASSNMSVATIGSATGMLSGLSVGSATITFTATATGCSITRSIAVTNVPTVYSMTGGGNYCAGGAGVHVGLSSTDPGVSYQLYNGATAVGSTVSGVGIPVDFGLQVAGGAYGVMANPGTSCATLMSGLATVVVNPLPTHYPVTGGGNYCSGGAGVHVYLYSSTAGVNYQLFVNNTPSGTTVPGTSAPIDFGLKTTAGVYTVMGTNTITACSDTMSGSVAVAVNPLPASFNVTGGGGYCTGAAGVHVGLSGSAAGISYQLLLAGTASAAPLTGTGSALDFGIQTTAGTYTVRATNSATSCSAMMSASAVVTVNPLPTVYTVTGGGNYCSSGTGVHIGLNGSAIGVNYQLYLSGAPSGAAVAGTGVSIDFGLRTAAGTYTVVATNASTTCTRSMSGTATIAINPLPSVFSVTGGGNYCSGGAGVHVGLSGSAVGITYELYNGTTLEGARLGTGSSVDFGLFTTAGIYKVVATNSATGCVNNMSGSATITVNPLPTVFTLNGGGNYCVGGTGVHIGLTGSTSGIRYQLYRGGAAVGGLVTGTGGTIDFGLETGTGSYTATATNSTSGCSVAMFGSVSVATNPLPTAYAVTGGGGYCTGGPGVPVGLSFSNIGIQYQLFKGGVATGVPVMGFVGPVDFGLQTAAGSYTVVATNITTTCTANMVGAPVISINSLPAVYNVSGGGNFCSGGTGVAVSLSNSATGISYQLLNGGSAAGGPVAGSGAAINFGLQTVAGTYHVTATNVLTGCTSAMSGTAAVATDPLPAVFSVTGGGHYCADDAGVSVGLSASTPGIRYQLYKGILPDGAPVAGTGGVLDFGLKTVAGDYTVVAENTTTSCSDNMSGDATVSIDLLPAVFTVTGGGDNCFAAAGVHVGLSNSATGFFYQLYNGAMPAGVPHAGASGAPLDFGLQGDDGVYSAVATNAATGCTNNMAGSAIVTVHPAPTPYTVTGGGSYCPGGTGLHVGLSGSVAGVTYQLYADGSSAGSPVAGTGAAVDFGLQTATGGYTVVATDAVTTCTGVMYGSASVALHVLPSVYNVTGGGSFCPGGPGVHIGLSGSNNGISYQLYSGSGAVGAPLSGNGLPLDFDLQTVPGGYTVVATDNTTTCTDDMYGSATVTASPLPAAFTVTGGGNYCSSGTGVSVGIDGSEPGSIYQLFHAGLPVGSTLTGTGGALDFGLQTAAGPYTVQALNPATTCRDMMPGSAAVFIDPLPHAYPVTGGGNYCSGDAGMNVGLSGSDAGILYQLYHGISPVGAPIGGTGSAIDFGLQTASGLYSVAATNTANACTNNMSGGAIITANPLPAVYAITGGGHYCENGTGAHVMLDGSGSGISYQLYANSVASGAPITGSGAAIDFGLQTVTGAYTVVATNTFSGCINHMPGSVSVDIDPLPATYSVSGAGTNYCVGGAGINISLSGSDAGTSYQLFNGAGSVGVPVPGSGYAIDFGPQLTAGVYTVLATNAATSCGTGMSGSATVIVNPLPAAHLVTGGGGYCTGEAGVNVGLDGSVSGTHYQLYNDGTPVGASLAGTGSPLGFGLQTTAGNYTVVATNTLTACAGSMSGSATVAVNPLPDVFTVTGGGNYCIGGTGVHVGLSGSAPGITYRLYRAGGMTGVSLAGTGSAIDFGLQTAPGAYTVIAANTATSCTIGMAAGVSVGTNALPAPYAVIGGGNYCQGGAGLHVGISGSAPGIHYQLYKNGTATGAPVTGTGSALDFGLQTLAGTYTVVAKNTTTLCTGNMSGSATIGINPLPVTQLVTGGGSYCAGGAGVHVGLSSSANGISYQLFNGATVAGAATGTGTALDFGLQTAAGTYTVLAVNPLTSCSADMPGSAAVVVTPLVSPSIGISTGAGDTVCSGSLATLSALAVNGGLSPAYEWRVNGVPAAASGSNFSFLPSDGDIVSIKLTSNAACASPAIVNSSMTLTVNSHELPSINVFADAGNLVCTGSVVNYTAEDNYGGSAPTYTWIKNGNTVSTAPSYSYQPGNKDVIYCVMTSNYKCRTANVVSSNKITMEVDEHVDPVVTVGASTGLNIAKGQSLTLTATATNAGPAPVYRWSVNGISVSGAASATYTSDKFSNGDVVSCEVVSSGGCAGLSGTGSATVSVSSVGVKQVASGNSNVQLIPNPNKGVFTVKGTLASTENEEVSLEIADMFGRVIYRNNVVTHRGNIDEQVQVDNSIANGVYLLSLRSASENVIFHVVIEK